MVENHLTHVLKEDEQGKIVLLYHDGISILDINAGFGDHESDNTMGYAFCKDCGHMTPREQLPSHEGKHLRPLRYRQGRRNVFWSLMHKAGNRRFVQRGHEDGLCISSNPTAIRRIQSIVVGTPVYHKRHEFENRLARKLVGFELRRRKRYWKPRGNDRLSSASPSNLQCRHEVCHLTKRPRRGHSTDGIRRGGFEIFIYERVDGGAGLLKQVYDNITDHWEGTHHRGSIFEEMKKILAGEKCLETTNEFSDNKIQNRGEAVRFNLPRILARFRLCSTCRGNFTGNQAINSLNQFLGTINVIQPSQHR